MAKIKVQLNHPGSQKDYKLNNDSYFLHGNKIYRRWNKDDIHYRKFLINEGDFVNSKNELSTQKSNLYFWGEWEGYSEFEQFPGVNSQMMPNGIHKPIFSSNLNPEKQNTDPYVFGDFFKYAICKQRGQLFNLDNGSLILFGSTYPSAGVFFIDTVFVVSGHETALNVINNKAENYSDVYINSTLKRLENEYINFNPKNKLKLYHSQTWWHNNEYFSFVPCKLTDDKCGFERLSIPLNKYPELSLSSYPSGKSYMNKCTLEPEKIWNIIYKEAIKQGFVFGIKFKEPKDEIIGSI
jgi:hypothetical protein